MQGSTQVLLLCQDLIGPYMAGPAIRCWEFSRVLSATCDVTLAAPLAPGHPSPTWNLVPITLEAEDEIDPLLASADIVISAGFALRYYPQLTAANVLWCLDAYIPSATESLASHSFRPMDEQLAAYRDDIATLVSCLQRADRVICANERQRDFYLGALAALGRVNPLTYGQDPGLDTLVSIVPYGLPEGAPVHTRAVLKGEHPGIDPNAALILWGGGLWNWFDPETLVRAMPLVAQRREDVRLYLPISQYPFHHYRPGQEKIARVRALSDGLGLSGSCVIFGGWIPYADRASYLLEADIGISLHDGGIESRYAHRTRLLDYVWAGLPIVATAGDSLGDQLGAEGLAITVNPGDVRATADAILAILSDPDYRSSRKERFAALAQSLTWEQVTEPLLRFCTPPKPSGDRAAGYHLPGQTLDEGECAALRCRVAELEHLVEAYRSGHFMRAMEWLATRRSRRK